jgi:hypothetical protein
MSLPTEPCACWAEIERSLGEPGPVPEDVRRYLWDVAHLLNLLVEGIDIRQPGDLNLPNPSLTPKQAAALVPEVLGLTGAAIGAHREARRAQGFGRLFEMAKEHGLVKRGEGKHFAAKLAAAAKVTPRQIHRWGELFRRRAR